MTNTICLDKNYSTTRTVTQEKPEIINNPEDKFETVLFNSPSPIKFVNLKIACEIVPK